MQLRPYLCVQTGFSELVRALLYGIFCLAGVVTAKAQTIDTLRTSESKVVTVDTAAPKLRNPKTATLLSAVLPGAGQVYNKKYWKLPIIYGGMGTAIYFALDNRKQYKSFKQAYINDTDDFAGTLNPYEAEGYSGEQLRTIADQYRTWMEWSYIAAGAIYALQIVDAAVDAHLFYFNVSEDLSMNWSPLTQYHPMAGTTQGFALSLKF